LMGRFQPAGANQRAPRPTRSYPPGTIHRASGCGMRASRPTCGAPRLDQRGLCRGRCRDPPAAGPWQQKAVASWYAPSRWRARPGARNRIPGNRAPRPRQRPAFCCSTAEPASSLDSRSCPPAAPEALAPPVRRRPMRRAAQTAMIVRSEPAGPNRQRRRKRRSPGTSLISRIPQAPERKQAERE
jgi:hypothetical protein